MKQAEQIYRIEYMYNQIAMRRGDYVLTLKSEDTLSEDEMAVLTKVMGETLTIEEQLRKTDGST